jgi:hypothetical protein
VAVNRPSTLYDALSVRRTGRRNIRTVIFFYLPGVDAFGLDGPFGGPWALADLSGPLKKDEEEVSILGFTIDEEIKDIARQSALPGELVGEWIEDSTIKRFRFIYQTRLSDLGDAKQ